MGVDVAVIGSSNGVVISVIKCLLFTAL